MRKYYVSLIIFLLFFPRIYSQDTFSGKYLAVDQAQYDQEKRWIEISRNQYQEIIVNSEYFLNVVAYYVADNQKTLLCNRKTCTIQHVYEDKDQEQ